MKSSESDSDADESQPDGVKRKIANLIKRFKQVTSHKSSQPDGAKRLLEEDPKDMVYDFNHPKRGVAIFIINSSFDNQPKRPFADEDCKKMMEMFVLLDFEIKLLENKTSRDLWLCLKEINLNIDSNCDCLACVISSHGAEVPIHSTRNCSPQPRHHVLFTKDGIIPTDTILQLFNDDHCPGLQGKPRMFFVQACRSIFGSNEEDEVDKGFEVELVYEQINDDQIPVKMKTNNGPLEKVGRKKDVTKADTQGRPVDHELKQSHFKTEEPVDFCLIPCFEDYLVMFSSSSERIAWSDCGKGGWLTYCLYEVFRHLLDTEYSVSLLQILTDVCRKMSNHMETRTPSKPTYHCSKSAATIYHMLTKDIFLRPVSHQMVPKPRPVLETSV